MRSAVKCDEKLADFQLLVDEHGIICGVDEAGRGPLAGPVVAAAVVFRDCETMGLARDSKTLSAKNRERIYKRIMADLEFAVGICSPAEIDEFNILRASLTAMERAVSGLRSKPDLILVDGLYGLSLPIPSRAIVHGDARIAVIGAASIAAKVTRDRLMQDYDAQYPGYGFAQHVGYPTAEHRAALRRLGPTPIHRRSFRGVRELLEETS
ncbi:ribonuclease HII [candidate division KSB1 bacterium]|nr:MAG: ribonuclease HII [candidate division KSB1 bacterium]